MRLVIIATAVAALSLAACGRKEEKAGVSVGPGGVVIKGKDGAVVTTGKDGSVVIKGKDGSMVTAGGANTTVAMPAFAPLYPGARTENTVANISNAKSDGGTVVYKVAATPDAVVKFYKEKAAASGFKTEMDADMGAAKMFAASDEASGKGLQVIASAADGGTSVQVIWATKRVGG